MLATSVKIVRVTKGLTVIERFAQHPGLDYSELGFPQIKGNEKQPNALSKESHICCCGTSFTFL